MQTPEALTLPPIVLFVGELQEFAATFEATGMWVATSTVAEALPTIADLRPDLIIAEHSEDPPARGLVARLKAERGLQRIPVIAVGATGTTSAADLALPKPLLPEALLIHATGLLRARQAAPPIGPTTNAPSRLKIVDGQESTSRPCPTCGHMLRWKERGLLHGLAYEYYDWCENGCGLACVECATGRWVILV